MKSGLLAMITFFGPALMSNFDTTTCFIAFLAAVLVGITTGLKETRVS